VQNCRLYEFRYLQTQYSAFGRDVCRSVAFRFVTWNGARRSCSDNFVGGIERRRRGADTTVRRLPWSIRSG